MAQFKVTMWNPYMHEPGNAFNIEAASKYEAAQKAIDIVDKGVKRTRWDRVPIIWEIKSAV